ncbi:cytochrome c maturation protein CcmE [Affinibrenneria salicis]|uniref:Cytochrome c-type biogenesis protein CcmE n=1 Tax=Affinibrenneria salicis TaxID=2590031 RepID=A0A5J5FUZ0_9GAMM|nr:cytochrome c maturation protein CcmE [Affinibrenneria salicis]KAA8996939.1 cytochrome c maturation protein CcmE [Affinibrenneria salicis]
MTTPARHRLMLVLLLMLGVGLTTSLVLYALSSNIDLFYTPVEIVNGKGEAHERPHVGQRLRVGGMVLPGSVQRDAQSLQVRFRLYDAQQAIDVTYAGILPDLFREGQGVVAQGELLEGNVVRAWEILARHDENYTPPEISAAMTDNHRHPAGTAAGRAGATPP